MTARSVLVLAMTVLAAVLAGMVLAIALRRVLRILGDRRRARTERVLRPRVAAVLADVPDRDDLPMRRRPPRADRGLLPGLAGVHAPAGPDGAAADEAVDRLIRLWRAGTPRDRRVLEGIVFGYLGKVRGPAHRTLVGFLERTGAVARARRRVRRPGAVGRARAAEFLGQVGGAEPELVRLLGDRQSLVRLVAVAGLRSARPLPGVVPALLAALDGPRPIPPTLVTEALVGLGPDAAPALATALTAGGRSAGMPEKGVAGPAIAAEALGLLRTVAATAALLAAVEDRAGNADVRIRAARALGRIGPPAALDRLARCLAAEEPPTLREVAARALGDLGSPRAVPYLVPLLAGPHRLATNAASALALLGPPGARALADAASREPVDPAGRYAAAALATLRLSRPAAAASVVPTLAG